MARAGRSRIFSCCLVFAFHGLDIFGAAQHDVVEDAAADPTPDEPMMYDPVPPKPPYLVPGTRQGAPLFDPALWPLSASSRFIVNANRERQKLACINWHGAYLKNYVVGGLSYWPLDTIAARIRDVGFNCVRLPYSTEGVLDNPPINNSDVSKNPEFKGLSMLEMLDKTIEALAKMGLMVIINNHNSKSGWCCSSDSEEGLWYTPSYSEEDWIRSLETLAERYVDNKFVVGFDIRNEPHDYGGVYLTWGSGDPKTDWAAAAERAGRAVLNKDPNVLIIVEGLCFAKELRPVHDHPLRLPTDRLVYSVHMYYFFQLFSAFTDVMSSEYAKHISFSVAGSFLPSAAVLFWWWHRVGRPRPPSGTILISCGTWLTILAFGSLAYSSFIYANLMGLAACAFVARNDVLPHVIISVCCMLLGIILLSFGCVRRSRGRRIAASESDESASEPDRSGGDSSEGVDDGARVPLMGNFASLRLAFASRDLRNMHAADFDLAMHLGLQLFAALVVLGVLAAGAFASFGLLDSYDYFRRHMDETWGFVLVRGNKYTAPVWVSEFGSSVRSDFWLKTLRYMSSIDVDWAYWPLNPYKQENKVFEDGGWKDIDPPVWSPDTWSFLGDDWMTVRHAWKLSDLRYIMQNPSEWIPDSEPCSRDLISNECGG